MYHQTTQNIYYYYYYIPYNLANERIIKKLISEKNENGKRKLCVC